jgi:hypothetical protein
MFKFSGRLKDESLKLKAKTNTELAKKLLAFSPEL